MKIKQYLIHCPNCKKQTPHYIFKINKTRGAKLSCLKCGHKKKQYSKLQFLHEYNPTQTKQAKAGGTL